jgi:hypothetical protein
MKSFEWSRDWDGEYLPIKSDEGEFDLRADGQTVLFVYVGKYACMSHIWRELPELGETEETIMGMRIWKRYMDEKFGEGTFDNLCEEMMDRGFAMAAEEEPSELDKQAYFKAFPQAQEEQLEMMIERLLPTDMESAAQYYLSEWSDQHGG